MDNKGRVDEANEEIARRLGHTLDEFVGQCVWDFISPKLARIRQDVLRRVIDSGQTIRNVDEEGGRWSDYTVCPVPDASGTIARVAVFARDITEMMAATHGRTARPATKAVSDEPGEIHILLTDVVMPKMNGRDLYELLKKRRPGLKVLFMSGYAEDIISGRGILDDNADFISKPFEIQALIRKVQGVIEAGS